jgi:amino acid permease
MRLCDSDFGIASVMSMHIDSFVCTAATWPQATCHTVTAVVGAGVLGLPYAFSYLGWYAGPIFLGCAAATSYYTSFQLAGMHEHEGKRLNRYQDVGIAVLGRPWGRWAIVPFQYIVMVCTSSSILFPCVAMHVQVFASCGQFF